MENQTLPPQAPQQAYSYPSEAKTEFNVWRIIAIVLFIVLIGIGGIYLFNNQSQKLIIDYSQQSQIVQPTSFVPKPKIINSELFQSTGNCTLDDCSIWEPGGLLPEGIVVDKEGYIGLAKVEGYYHKYDSVYFNRPITCEGLIVTGGHGTLINSLRQEAAKKDIGVNTTVDNKLILNINTGVLDQNLKEKIQSSSLSNPVNLRLIKRLQGDKGVDSCYSLVDILSAR